MDFPPLPEAISSPWDFSESVWHCSHRRPHSQRMVPILAVCRWSPRAHGDPTGRRRHVPVVSVGRPLRTSRSRRRAFLTLPAGENSLWCRQEAVLARLAPQLQPDSLRDETATLSDTRTHPQGTHHPGRRIRAVCRSEATAANFRRALHTGRCSLRVALAARNSCLTSVKLSASTSTLTKRRLSWPSKPNWI